MISGPYRHGTTTEDERQQNLKLMNEYALKVLKMGHVPVIGVNLALPIIKMNNASYDDIMMPLSLGLAKRCDAVLRIGGESKGADDEMHTFKLRDLPIYRSLEDIPPPRS
ncbi:MAG: hypothetical protein JJ975_03215 [Bacteroidia bacterium]|nr:hypothetical protein [Bacteroidia bacterium]